MKPNRLAGATIATFLLGAPALALAQLPPGDGQGEGTTTEGEPAIPEEPPPPPANEHGAGISYDGGFKLGSADDQFEVKLGLRSQFRFDVLRPEADDELLARFALNRLRLQLEGHAYGPKTTFKIEFDLANRGFAILKDAFIDHAISPTLHVRAGQWKKPINRQELVSDFGSELVERSLVNGFVGAGRDQGVALHNDYEKSPEGVEWALGVYNASSDRPTLGIDCEAGAMPTDPPECDGTLPTNVPADVGPLLVARVGFNSGKIKGYSEGDLEGGPLRFAAAAGYQLNPHDLEEVGGDKRLTHTVVLDAMIKASGFSLTGAFALVKDGQADAQFGFYGQASYVVMPKKLLAAARFAQVPAPMDEQRHEILGGFDWLWKGHKAKVMVDAGVIRTTGDAGATDLQIRSQLQVVL